MSITLLVAAIIPVVLLAMYIYKKDVNKEPKKMLIKLFIFGILICIPVIIIELFFEKVFIVDENSSFLPIFISNFVGIALVEEFFKWIVTKNSGYNSENFDEIYDIIVYSVFVSLGFAGFENIGYVFGNGLGVAIVRALLSVPGHTCFAVLMGYYLSKAKVNSLNGNVKLYKKNLFLSIFVPSLFHGLFDAFLTAGSYYILLFLVLHIVQVVYCFKTVNKVSKMQQSITNNIKEGNIVTDSQGNVVYNTSNIIGEQKVIKFCPICGRNVEGYNFCPSCGFKLKDFEQKNQQ